MSTSQESTTDASTNSEMDSSVPLKRPLPQDSPRSTKQPKNKKTKTGECICPICMDPIVDATETREGQDSIFCEGQCSAWIHRRCAGLSKPIFDTLTESEIPFQCPHCTLHSHTSEIAKLKEVIESFTKSITQLQVTPDKPATKSDNKTTLTATASQPAVEPQTTASESTKRISPDQKFNIVMYGIKESPPNTNRPTRLDQDLTNITLVFSQTDLPLEQSSIRDCHRLGKFNEATTKPRPILITFLRSGDASLALSKISSFKGPVRIKPDLSPEERTREAVLMKQRWSLIQRGAERRRIKIRNGALSVDNQLYERLSGSDFCRTNYNPPLHVNTSTTQN